MPSGIPKPDLIVKDLVDIHDGLRRGDIQLMHWNRASDIHTLGFRESLELHDLRPVKRRVIPADNTENRRLLEMLNEVIAELHAGKRTNVHLLDIQKNQTFTPPIDFGGILNVKLTPQPGIVEIFLEFIVIPDLQKAASSMTASANVFAQSMTAISKLISSSMVNVNDIPLPHEKLHDLGVGIEPIVGYRDFYPTHTENGDVVLCSRNKAVWTPRKKFRALCKRSGNDPFSSHDAPNVNCQCGIYAFDTPDHEDMRDGAYVWGEVNLWGEVLICETGYRAEYAYPKTLFIRTNGTKTIRWLADELEYTYGVPVFLVSAKDGQTLKQVIDHALTHMLKGGENKE